MKKPTKKDVKRVLDFLDGIQWLFHANNLDRRLILKEEQDGNTFARIEYREDYQELRLYIFPLFWEHARKDQRKILLHELSHVITLPQYQFSLDLLDGKLVSPHVLQRASEEATSRIENLLDGLLTGKYQYARAAYKEYLG